jgi:hypothetical protein
MTGVALDAATSLALILGGTAVMNELSNWVDDARATQEHDEYKERYREPMPPGMDECEQLRWKLKREQRLLEDRQNWDARWAPGTHDEAIRQTQNAIRNLEREIKSKCQDSCPKN